MTRLPTVAPTLTAGLLHRAGDDASRAALLARPAIDWTAEVRYAGDALVLPAWREATLAPPVRAALPADVDELLELVVAANGARNRGLLADFEHVAAVLNGAGTVPTAIKGIAVLLAGDWPAPAGRVCSDVDTLVRPAELPGALEALRAAGYRQLSNPYADPDVRFEPLDPRGFRNTLEHGRHHVPALTHPDHPSTVELHLRVEEAVVPLARALTMRVHDGARRTRHGAADVDLPSPAWRLAHDFVHSQLIDQRVSDGSIDWRHLLDASHLLDAGPADELAAPLVELALRERTGHRLALHAWLLREALGDARLVDALPPALWNAPRSRRCIERFGALRGAGPMRVAARLAIAADAALSARNARRWLNRLSPARLRKDHGPGALPALLRSELRYRRRARRRAT